MRLIHNQKNQLGVGVFAYLLWPLAVLFTHSLVYAAPLHRVYNFDLPPDSLSHTLERYSQQTGVSVAVDVAHMHASTSLLKARLNALEALQHVLRGTGLVVRQLSADSLVVVRGWTTMNSSELQRYELAGLNPRNVLHKRYAAQLQTNLIAGLCNTAITRPGSYRLALQLRIDSHGKVIQHKRLDTSGNPERDRYIDEIVASTYVGAAPPSDLAQPVLILILPVASNAYTLCNKVNR